MALHHLTEYNVDGGAWIQAYADEEAGPGKSLVISGLAPGTYQVRLRITPLTGGGPAVVSNPVEVVITQDVVNQTQIKQIQAIESALQFIASGAQVAAVQVGSVLGSMLFSGVVEQTQPIQVELSSASGVNTGDLAETQIVQSNSSTGLLEFVGVVDNYQTLQSSVINSIVEFMGTSVQTQTVQSEAISGGDVITGSVLASQVIQANNIAAIIEFVGSAAIQQLAQNELVEGEQSVPISGTVVVNQAVQNEANSATLVFYATSEQNQSVQSEVNSGTLSFSGSITESQIKQIEAISASVSEPSPAQVTGLSVSNSPAQLTATWADLSDETSYELFYSTDPDLDETTDGLTGYVSTVAYPSAPTSAVSGHITGISVGQLAYTLNGMLTAGVTYYVRVAGRNAAGLGPLSAAAAASLNYYTQGWEAGVDTDGLIAVAGGGHTGDWFGVKAGDHVSNQYTVAFTKTLTVADGTGEFYYSIEVEHSSTEIRVYQGATLLHAENSINDNTWHKMEFVTASESDVEIKIGSSASMSIDDVKIRIP